MNLELLRKFLIIATNRMTANLSCTRLSSFNCRDGGSKLSRGALNRIGLQRYTHAHTYTYMYVRPLTFSARPLLVAQ